MRASHEVMRLRLNIAFAAVILAGFPAAAQAEPVRAVVEMYTSQGCASCPPADRLTGALSKEPGILALTLPVTYWDYLGWKDSLATHAFTDRQRAYASVRSDRSLFTPQAIINGQDVVVGSDRQEIAQLIEKAKAAGGLPVGLRVEERNERIVVDVEADASGRRGEVWLLPIARHRLVDIERGENKGRQIVYENVVRGMQRLGAWAGQSIRFEVPRESARKGGADAYVVMLQNAAGGRLGAILAAAKGPGW